MRTLTASGIDLVISKYGVKITTNESNFDEICNELENVAGGVKAGGQVKKK